MQIDPIEDIPADLGAVGLVEDLMPCAGVDVDGHIGHTGVQHGLPRRPDAGGVPSAHRIGLAGDVEHRQVLRYLGDEVLAAPVSAALGFSC